MRTIRVLVVDDHRLFAEAVSARLAQEPDLTVLPLAYNEEHAKRLITEHRPDLLLLDLALGRDSGMAVLEHARRQRPDTRTLVLTAVGSADHLFEAVRRGATGWLPKTVDTDQLVAAVRGVAGGEGWIPAELLGDLLARLVAVPQGEDPGVLSGLTPREFEVFRCMVDGLSRQQIARRLYLSTETVRTHTQNVLAKLGVHSVLEAVALGLRAGMRPSEYQERP
ncbi:MAG TPA: response regulator transcription factor [Micromonosporaceae bacterium]